jgi:hypothetical protein
MYDEFQRYLEIATTPENAETCLSTCKLLEQFGILNHSFDINQMLSTIDRYPTEDNLTDFYTLLQEYAASTLLEFGIVVDSNMPLSRLNAVLEAMYTLPNYGDPDALLIVLEQERSPEEQFCDLLGILTPYSWQDFIDSIKMVNPALLERLSTVLTENRPIELQPPEYNLERLRFLIVKDLTQPVIAMQAVQNGTLLKTPILQLLNGYTEAFLSINTQPEALASELLGLLALSDTPVIDYITLASDLLENLAKDINVTTKALSHFKRLYTELEKTLGETDA